MSYREASAPLDLVFVEFNGSVKALDRASGQVRWRAVHRGSVSRLVMCSDGERLYTFRAATLSALDVATGAIVWEVSVPVDLTAIDLRLESAGDVLLVAVEGTLLAYSTLDGSLRWQTAATEGSFVCLPAQVSPRSETSR